MSTSRYACTATYWLGGSGLSGRLPGRCHCRLAQHFSVPLAVISLPLGIIGTILYGLRTLALTLWVIVLLVLLAALVMLPIVSGLL